MTVRIAFLLGREPGEGSILPALTARLHAAGAQVSVDLVDADLPTRALQADLAVLRGLSPTALEAAARLDAEGIRCCNSRAATAAARDKASAAVFLAAAGIPVPPMRAADDWPAVRRAAAGRAVVVKSTSGSRGRGVLHSDGRDLPEDAPFPGPYLVEDRLDYDGSDAKLYLVGEAVDGVRRVWPPRGLEDKLGTPFAPPEDLSELARAAAAALGLELAGVDVIVGASGPVVVDVNAFPGYKGAFGGVGGASALLADHLLAAATAATAATAQRVS
ncbi:MAG: hypothetical protein H0V05_02810 [Euzebyaceae bacterium]|nr:hypothetical protein [Euzebyaceae bacterium]